MVMNSKYHGAIWHLCSSLVHPKFVWQYEGIFAYCWLLIGSA